MVAAQLITQLQGMTGVDAGICRLALEAHAGDLERALRALVASGHLTRRQARPLFEARPDLAALASSRRTLAELSQVHPELLRRLNKTAEKDILKLRRSLLEALGPMPPAPGPALSDDAPSDITPELQQLHAMCAADYASCAAALRANRNDVSAALRSLVASGAVVSLGLHPELVSEEFYALALIFKVYSAQSAAVPEDRDRWGITKASLARYEQQLSGKLPLTEQDLSSGRFDRQLRLNTLHPRPKVKAPKPKLQTLAPAAGFPQLKDCGDWEGEDTLTAWKGFQARSGAYTSRSSSKPSTGKVQVFVAALRSDSRALPPAPEQIAAYQHLKQNQASITDAVVSAIYKAYPKMRKEYGFKESDYQDELYMPRIKSRDALRELIGLGTVHVLGISKAGHAYIGFECGCSWDEEHGLGVLTHKGRVIEVGQADISFDSSLATRDGGRKIKPGQK